MRPGGAYIHISRTFGNYYLGFITMWMKLVAFVGAISFMSTSFGEYMTFFFPNHDPRMWGTIVLLFFYGVNIIGIRYYGQFQTAMLIVLIISILILVIPGIPAIDYSYYDPILPKGYNGLLAAMPMLFFSYAGFETLAQVAGETKDPTRTLPMIFIKGVLASVFIFFTMSFVAFGVLPADVLASSNSAMADVAAQYLPPWGSSIVAIGAMSAFLTSINGSILVPSRMLFVFSEDRLMPRSLASVHPQWRTPYISLIISAIICTALIWSQSARYLMNAGLIGIFIIYCFQGIALMALPIVNKRLYKSAQFQLPKWLLYLVGSISAFSMAYFLIITIMDVFTFTIVGLIVGTILYILGRYQGKKEGFNYHARMEQDYHLLDK
jgi:amino acid transporter